VAAEGAAAALKENGSHGSFADGEEEGEEGEEPTTTSCDDDSPDNDCSESNTEPSSLVDASDKDENRIDASAMDPKNLSQEDSKPEYPYRPYAHTLIQRAPLPAHLTQPVRSSTNPEHSDNVGDETTERDNTQNDCDSSSSESESGGSPVTYGSSSSSDDYDSNSDYSSSSVSLLFDQLAKPQQAAPQPVQTIGGRGPGGRGPGRGSGFGRGFGRGPSSSPQRIKRPGLANSAGTGLSPQRIKPPGLANSAGSSFGSSNDSRGREMLLKRAASERFIFRATNPDEPIASAKTRLQKRSLSMDLGTKKLEDAAGKDVNPAPAIKVAPLRLAFGASREQAHYQPTVIRKSRKLDIQTGGETYREVVCQRIIDYPEAMNPAERRRKQLMRRAEEEEKNRASLHGVIDEPQYRLHSKLQSSGRAGAVSIVFIQSPAAVGAQLFGLILTSLLIVPKHLSSRNSLQQKMYNPGH
jgi:hypothetical protein